MGDGELRTVAYGHDGLGSIRAVVSHGTVQEQYHYDAFGKPFGDELESDGGITGSPMMQCWGITTMDSGIMIL